jgi:hypothetical protein
MGDKPSELEIYSTKAFKKLFMFSILLFTLPFLVYGLCIVIIPRSPLMGAIMAILTTHFLLAIFVTMAYNERDKEKTI